MNLAHYVEAWSSQASSDARVCPGAESSGELPRNCGGQGMDCSAAKVHCVHLPSGDEACCQAVTMWPVGLNH